MNTIPRRTAFFACFLLCIATVYAAAMAMPTYSGMAESSRPIALVFCAGLTTLIGISVLMAWRSLLILSGARTHDGNPVQFVGLLAP